jgi:hypothetical protein
MKYALNDTELKKLAGHWRGKDPAEAVAALHRQGLVPKDIAVVVDRSLRQVYRLIKESGGLSKAERRAQLEGLPDLGAMTELSEDERELILSHTAAGFELFFSRFSHLIPGDVAGPLPPHTIPWVLAYFDNELLMINVPPGHWKSVIFSVAMPLYEVVCNRAIKIILISRSAELATQWTRNIVSVMVEDAFVRAFGKFAPTTKGESMWQVGVGSIRVNPGGSEFTILSRGAQTQIFGRRADLIIVDDPTNTDIARSELEGGREFTRFKMEAMTRQAAASKVVIVGQRLGARDFFGRVLDLRDEYDKPLFHVERYPAVLRWPDRNEKGEWIPETAEVLDPVHWPWEVLVKRLSMLGESVFETMYQQVPRSLEGGLMSSETFAKARDDRPAWKGRREAGAAAVKAEGQGRQNPYVRVLSIDPSPTRFFGCVLADVAVKSDGTTDTWVLGNWRFQAKREGSLDDFMTRLNQVVQRTRVDFVIIEEVQYVGWMRETQWWAQIFDAKNAPKFLKQNTTAQTKNHVLYGLRSLVADWEQGRMHLPYGDRRAREMTDLLQQECENYEDGSGQGGDDDQLMALWFIKSCAKKLKVRPKRSGIIPGYGAGRPNAIGRKMLADRYNRPSITVEQMREQDRKEALAKRAADELVNDWVAGHGDVDEEEVAAV